MFEMINLEAQYLSFFSKEGIRFGSLQSFEQGVLWNETKMEKIIGTQCRLKICVLDNRSSTGNLIL